MKTLTRLPSLSFILLLGSFALGCGDDDDAPVDAGSRDAATQDATTTTDAGLDATTTADGGTDAGALTDAGEGDAGDLPDAADSDAGATDAGATDAGGGADGGPVADWRSCSLPSECVLQIDGCCSPCGLPELEDFDAVAMSKLAEHRMQVCTEPEPVICPLCATLLNPYLLATCDSGACRELDTRAEPFAACTSNDDCSLRVPDCCECGADTSAERLIAVSNRGAFATTICDPGTVCLECVPSYPSTHEAYCNAGRCEVRELAE